MLMIRKTAVAAGAAAALLMGAGVAHAEGGFDTRIGGWLTGKESRKWDDKNRDANATTVKFGGCSVDGASRFISATIQLKRVRAALPDPVEGRHDNRCNTSNFGRQGDAEYYFNLSKINGTDTGLRLSVDPVNVRY
ncbi:hypothetical protein [Streptomyces sp. NPDC005953]|uniref:hypothetical protein n=1 Tax=Streptomyces sp. NPDC005953 TaxID=3156719 RepID=UPI0033F33AB8